MNVSNHHAAKRLSACEFMNKLDALFCVNAGAGAPPRLEMRARASIGAALIAVAVLSVAPIVAAQEYGQPAKPATQEGKVDAPATAYEKQEHAAEEHGGEHGGLSALLWPTVNFVILVGGLWWFFKQPVATYLHDRHDSIRKDLVEAANVKAGAAAQLAEIDRKLQALPGELEALKHRGAEEIAAEEQRIAAMAAAERERLLQQTRREIALQVRIAKHELVEHAADLAVQLAGDRIQRTMTPADQERLVDRYLLDMTRRSAEVADAGLPRRRSGTAEPGPHRDSGGAKAGEGSR
jgi:F0F1-type ATP synthase membrane subunit b/b'